MGIGHDLSLWGLKVKVMGQLKVKNQRGVALRYDILDVLYVSKARTYVNGNVVGLTSIKGRNAQRSNNLREKHHSFVG